MKQYKALMYNNILVDEKMLFKGIYPTDEPKLYSLDTTIEELVSIYKKVQNLISGPNSFNLAIDNLRECELIIVDLKINQGADQLKVSKFQSN